MRYGSLFSGIGGLDLGLDRAGLQVAWQVEVEAYCVSVLEKNWPGVRRYTDVREIDWREVEPVEVVAGGFPCQPVSTAGKNLAEDDPRWLWPEFRRALRYLRPRFAIIENVPGILNRGAGEVLGDLSALGYDAEWETLPARAFGAPHLRERTFFLAWLRESFSPIPDPDGVELRVERKRRRKQYEEPGETLPRINGPVGALADADRRGREVERLPEFGGIFRKGGSLSNGRRRLREFVYSPGGSAEAWSIESDLGRVVNGFPGRVAQIRALGNAVVPQVAEYLGRILLESIEEK